VGLAFSQVNSLGAARIENTASYSSSIVECFFSNNSSTVVSASVAAETCLQRHYLAMDIFSSSTIPAFSRHVNIHSYGNHTAVNYLSFVV
jgi:hypothetical protein